MTTQTCDIVVIGAGMAGASVASELASNASVILLEREDQPGYHSTGRSAAMYVRNYGNAIVRTLTAASFEFLSTPPDGFSEHPLLAPRGVMIVATPEQEALLADTIASGTDIHRLTVAQALQKAPLLEADRLVGAAFEPDAMDMDVNAIHQGYLRRFKIAGGKLLCNARVERLELQGDIWEITTSAGVVSAPLVVNAAGAWADQVAELAGACPVGLTPKRRTAAIVAAPEGADVTNWPLILDVDENFYFKPEAGKILLSPADETPVSPCDIQPEDLDIAVAIDRIEQIVNFNIHRVEHRWAGLRTFAHDLSPVVGWDPGRKGFFWLAGQGGYGIQMAPALAMLAADWIRGPAFPEPLIRQGVTEYALSPVRFNEQLLR